MKYASTSYEYKTFDLSGKAKQNIGDWIQTIAVEKLYDEWGIKDYIRISRNTLSSYNGENATLFLNGVQDQNDALNYRCHSFPIPSHITPVLASVNFLNTHPSCQVLEQLMKNAPIGCRDEWTYQNMIRMGIPAYIGGCVTALLPRRKKTPLQNKVIICDVPKALIDYIPENIRENAEYITHSYLITRTSGTGIMTRDESRDSYETGEKTLEYYKEHASLVITSRLHAAVPCMAMGIPVILATNRFDGRYSWIDKFLPLYDHAKWDTIDWNPKPIEYEDIKEKTKKVLKYQLENAISGDNRGVVTEDMKYLTRFWSDRERYNYDFQITRGVHQFINLKNQKYAIWGLKYQVANDIEQEIQRSMQGWELVQILDKKAEGFFEGVKIDKIEDIKADKDVIWFVCAKTAFEDAKELITKFGGKYVLAATSIEKWETNVL